VERKQAVAAVEHGDDDAELAEGLLSHRGASNRLLRDALVRERKRDGLHDSLDVGWGHPDPEWQANQTFADVVRHVERTVDAAVSLTGG
jgi:hypothetical protein